MKKQVGLQATSLYGPKNVAFVTDQSSRWSGKVTPDQRQFSLDGLNAKHT